MLDIREADVYFVTFMGDEPESVLVDLQVTNRLLALEVGPDHQVLQLVLTDVLGSDQLLERFFSLGFLDLALCLLSFHLFNTLFDLFGGH